MISIFEELDSRRFFDNLWRFDAEVFEGDASLGADGAVSVGEGVGEDEDGVVGLGMNIAEGLHGEQAEFRAGIGSATKKKGNGGFGIGADTADGVKGGHLRAERDIFVVDLQELRKGGSGSGTEGFKGATSAVMKVVIASYPFATVSFPAEEGGF